MKPKNFIMLFTGKEGTTAMLHTLSQFRAIGVVRLEDEHGLEPFDRHNCGQMPQRDLFKCLDLIFTDNTVDHELLNAIYMQTGRAPLAKINPHAVVKGFKKRYYPAFDKCPGWVRSNRTLYLIWQWPRKHIFRRRLLNYVKREHITILLAVRQDIFRWALSIYHEFEGGRAAQYQFRLAKGELRRSDIGQVHVDVPAFKEHLRLCLRITERNFHLHDLLKKRGIDVHIARYEQFNAHRGDFLQGILEALNLTVGKQEMMEVTQGADYYQKVHSDNIETFVVNPRDLAPFRNIYVRWGNRDDLRKARDVLSHNK